MRVVSGKLKGRRFSPPASFKARPTTDQARESLFNILNNLISFEDLEVLDLFGGTGAMSYEFASRGALSVTTVEKSFPHFKYIITTCETFGLTDTIKVVKADVFKYLQKENRPYSLIFADPPFSLPELKELPSIIINSKALQSSGLFILEHGPDNNFENHPNFWQQRNYGKVNFSFFQQK
ncbi:RsmD family RNA methyltransferase [Marinilabilia salmonicolor]|jgi:16S rRNA (guanine(966)-N(2))-methyltransferase RsmD|uniref:16S rRNA (Guanine(966)-N(2))-methyltransferase RsmD n=1 Tax=Marinilabilia salmonicolor TaxID=989 RepID=A0A2T0XAS5_9BACT|nr:RsmD family RNA methyltransferase [Marinilabilia salmonicolor]PRY96019.1 16S rRNA (guanine(966)-N(2))-methyltransferase RsmD [Marinilabilia salmonicolor]RCW29434.1 16S rRNA (guanine(966)-N(2))-methyltransferase RsmD [Marinilabilia salmonicolor]